MKRWISRTEFVRGSSTPPAKTRSQLKWVFVDWEWIDKLLKQYSREETKKILMAHWDFVRAEEAFDLLVPPEGTLKKHVKYIVPSTEYYYDADINKYIYLYETVGYEI